MVLLAAGGCSAEGLPNSDGLEWGPADARVYLQNGLQEYARPGGGSSGLLIDHGGKILPSSNLYTIWWGTQSAFPADAVAGLDALLQGFNGSSLLGVARQYMRGGSVASNYVASDYVDTGSIPPSSPPTTAAIVSEACKTISAHGLVADANALYVVYTSNFPGRGN